MGYFDPPRITESTMRDSIRKSLGCCSFFPPSPRSSFELTEPRALSGSQAAMDWKRDGAKEREKKRKEKKKDEMKRRRRERGARWQRERLARTKQARKKGTRRVLAPKTEETNEDERASEDTTWWKGPREGSSSSPLLFSAPSRENSPSFSSCPAVSSPWNVHRRTSRCNLPYETCTYTCIHRARILPLSPLSTFLPRNARTRVCLSASRAESSPPFVRIRKSSTVERLSSSSWMEIGIPLPLCTSQDSIVGNSKWRNRVTKRNRIWVIWTKDYITRLLSL